MTSGVPVVEDEDTSENGGSYKIYNEGPSSFLLINLGDADELITHMESNDIVASTNGIELEAWNYDEFQKSYLHAVQFQGKSKYRIKGPGTIIFSPPMW
ncbi:unnamed protein product [Rotaria sp. Silwood2]|nr:unnamed protein product [Rotaria sp. Silwood2]CAF4329605.1 unnamed protein product [Rotaria sp. Silwood2]